MRIYFVLFSALFCCVQLSVQAQNQPVIDSLLQLLETEVSDQGKVDVYVKLAGEYDRIDTLQTMRYVNLAVALADAIGYPEGSADAMYEQGWARMMVGNYDGAEAAFTEGLVLAGANNYLVGKANIFGGLGVLGSLRKNYSKALDYQYKSLKIELELGDEKSIASTYGNIGAVNLRMGNYQKAIEYFLKTMEIDERLGNERSLMVAYYNIGWAYLLLNDLTQSLTYSQKSLAIAEARNHPVLITKNLSNIGRVYRKQGAFDVALEYHLKAMQQFNIRGNKLVLVGILVDIGSVYLELNKPDSVFKYAYEANKLVNDIGISKKRTDVLVLIGKAYQKKNQLAEARAYFAKAQTLDLQMGDNRAIQLSTKNLAAVEALLGDYQSAYENQVLYQEVSDSLVNEDKTKAIARLEAEYVFEKEKDSIQFSNASEKLLLSQTINRQKTVQIATLAGIAVLAVIVFILYRYYRSKQKANKLLRLQRDEIEQKNKELSSLDHAKSRFFANISHELRTPLTLISGPLDTLLQGGTAGPTAADNLKLMRANTDKLRGLVDDILEVSRLESDKVVVKP